MNQSNGPIRVNHSYQSFIERLTELGIPENYAKKAMEEYKLKEFPEVGLSDIGLNRLLDTSIDIYHSEIDLIPREPVEENLPVPKIKKESKLKEIIENIKDTSIPRTLWKVTKKTGVILLPLVVAIGAGYLSYSADQNLTESIALGVLSGAVAVNAECIAD
ncbi:Uncharacterised protein [uncultured archaeon]|nr:Uncharacterised protein [uncultured archaeon]